MVFSVSAEIYARMSQKVNYLLRKSKNCWHIFFHIGWPVWKTELESPSDRNLREAQIRVDPQDGLAHARYVFGAMRKTRIIFFIRQPGVAKKHRLKEERIVKCTRVKFSTNYR